MIWDTSTCIRGGTRGRFFNVVDLVNKLDAEARADRQGRVADLLCRLDFLILDELGYLPFAQAGGQLLFHLISRLAPRPAPGCACAGYPAAAARRSNYKASAALEPPGRPDGSRPETQSSRSRSSLYAAPASDLLGNDPPHRRHRVL